jgi:hypothetical protein
MRRAGASRLALFNLSYPPLKISCQTPAVCCPATSARAGRIRGIKDAVLCRTVRTGLWTEDARSFEGATRTAVDAYLQCRHRDMLEAIVVIRLCLQSWYTFEASKEGLSCESRHAGMREAGESHVETDAAQSACSAASSWEHAMISSGVNTF